MKDSSHLHGTDSVHNFYVSLGFWLAPVLDQMYFVRDKNGCLGKMYYLVKGGKRHGVTQRYFVAASLVSVIT